jgi:uncharacterized cupin superfamily protein
MNGHVYQAKPGDGVFFEPGTNIAHTILNETNEPVEYICVGDGNDPNRKEKVIYPLHPARNRQYAEKGFFWADAPRVDDFGPHNGEASLENNSD